MKKKLILICGGVLISGAPFAWWQRPWDPPADIKERGGILEVGVSRTKPRVLDVVLVHGLGGNPISTWQATRDPATFWPSWLAEEFEDCGVYSIDYAASPTTVGQSMSFQDRAINLLNRLDVRKLGHDRPIVFITHSLGGLVVKQMYHRGLTGTDPGYKSLINNADGVLFLSTPHRGADLADFATQLGKVIQGRFGLSVPSILIEQLRSNESQLRDLNSWYVENLWQKIDNQVLYEKYDTGYGWFWGSVRVVDESSSDPGIPGMRLVPIDADHLTICKPTNPDDQIYFNIKSFVEKSRTKIIERTARRAKQLSILAHDVDVTPSGRWNFIVRFEIVDLLALQELRIQVASAEDFESPSSDQVVKEPGSKEVVFAMSAQSNPAGYLRLIGKWTDGRSTIGKAVRFEVTKESEP